MANKYIIEGATYNGDGTTSEEAASAGAAGAWNHINILTGTAVGYGAISAGDVIYFRSKSSAGANITITLGAAATMGSSAGSSDVWVTWVLDNGTVWPGVDGVLTIAQQTYWLTIANYNAFISKTKWNWLFTCGVSSTGGMVVHNLSSVGWFINYGLSTYYYGINILTGSTNATAKMRDLKITNVNRYGALFDVNHANSKYELVNPTIELLGGDTDPVFGATSSSTGSIAVFGGKISGVGATTGVSVISSTLMYFRAMGLIYPSTMKYATGLPGNSVLCLDSFAPNGVVGADGVLSWGTINSRADGYFPTLNAVLPDSVSTPWSWCIYPSAATPSNRFCVPISKLYTSAPAAVTAVLEFLIPTTFSIGNKKTMWVEGVYVDAATGNTEAFSTQLLIGDALDASSAGWSSTTYGAVNFNKKSITLTTPSSVKQDTVITFLFVGTTRSASAADIVILCPDVQIT
jgi:hypothetical protein